MHHPWIKQQSTLHSGEDAAHEMQRHQDIVDSLQAFSEADDLKRVALEVIAFSTPPGKLDPEPEPGTRTLTLILTLTLTLTLTHPGTVT